MRKQLIVGIDEVGRDSIAGYIDVGAFLINKKYKKILKGIKDSKKLSSIEREEWYKKIKKYEKNGFIKYRLFFVSEKIIDKSGLSYSLKLAVSNCLILL